MLGKRQGVLLQDRVLGSNEGLMRVTKHVKHVEICGPKATLPVTLNPVIDVHPRYEAGKDTWVELPPMKVNRRRCV